MKHVDLCGVASRRSSNKGRCSLSLRSAGAALRVGYGVAQTALWRIGVGPRGLRTVGLTSRPKRRPGASPPGVLTCALQQVDALTPRPPAPFLLVPRRPPGTAVSSAASSSSDGIQVQWEQRPHSIWDLITPRVATAADIQRVLADMAKGAAATGGTKWFTRTRAWVGETSIQAKQLLEFEMEPDEEAEAGTENLMILGSVAEVKGAADANGQTLEINFLACSDDPMEQEMAGKKFLMHLCTKKKCPITDAGMSHPLRWRRLTASTLTKADWLGDKLPNVLVAIKQKQLRGSIAGSVTGVQEGFLAPFDPGARRAEAPAADGRSNRPLATLMKAAPTPRFGAARKKPKLGNTGLAAALLGAKQAGSALDDDEEEDEEEEDPLDVGAGALFGRPKQQLPVEIHEKEPGKLYFDFMTRVNRIHRHEANIKACLASYVSTALRPTLGEKAIRGYRELMTIGISMDHMIEFMDQLVASGAFTQEQIWTMHSLMRALDVLTQRFKVILDSEQTIARGGEVKPAAVWATNAHLELIPAAEIDLIGAEEKRSAVRAEKTKMSVFASAGKR